MGMAGTVWKALGSISGWTGADWRQESKVCQRLGSPAGVGQGRRDLCTFSPQAEYRAKGMEEQAGLGREGLTLPSCLKEGPGPSRVRLLGCFRPGDKRWEE